MNNTVRPDELSATLRRLRQDARLTGIEAAQAAGLSQPKISRLETSKQVPTAAEVQALCRAYGAPGATRAQLLAVAHDMREEQVSARVMLQRGAYRMQERIGRIEAASRLLRTFYPAVVIGLVQTKPASTPTKPSRCSAPTPAKSSTDSPTNTAPNR